MHDTDSAPLGLVVRLLDLRITRLAAARQSEIDVSPADMSVLSTIGADPGLRASAVAAKLMIKPPNLTKLVNRLEAEGLVHRAMSREDERAIALNLTARGRRAVAFGQRVSREIEELLLAELPAEARTRFLPWLHNMLRAAESAPAKAMSEAEP